MIDVQKLSQIIFTISSQESLFYPIDRRFVEKYLELIMGTNTKEFILFNLNSYPQTYTNQLLYCLPETWEYLLPIEWEEIIDELSSVPSLISALSFLYKYLKVDYIHYFVNSPIFSTKIKVEIINYFINISNDFFFSFEEENQDIIDFGIDIRDTVEYLHNKNEFMRSVSSPKEFINYLVIAKKRLKIESGNLND